VSAETRALRAEIAFRGAELVIARATIGRLERKLAGTQDDPNACPYDGRPCIASKGTDDEHFRCGTSACHRP
jgi:hypothetical protein